jgi:two-component system, NarL family, nitrate/nitrite response regulator NarL
MTVKVLILEDNPVARNFLCRVVRESFSDAHHITEAGDLQAARRAISQTNASARADGPSLAQLDVGLENQGTRSAGPTSPAGGASGYVSALEPFKLILVDLELPDGNGLELLSELAQYPATKIVTTLYSDDEHLFPALQCGADGYLLKEDRFEVLVEELQKIVRGQPPLSPAIARRLLTHFRHGLGQGHGNGSGQEAPPPAETGLLAAAHLQTASRPVAMERPAETERLTPRETEVLTYLSKGFTIKEIANLMGIKWFTVNDHIKSIYKKLNVSSRAEAAVLASKQGLV